MARMNKKKKIGLAVISVVLVAAVVIGVLALSGKSEPVAVYRWDMVGYRDYYSGGGESSGLVKTDKVQTLYVSETQKVTQILVEQGQQVKKGDVLLTYDTTLSDLALERKDLDVQQKQVTLDNARVELDRLYAMQPMVVTPPPETKPDPEKVDHTKSPADPNKLNTVYDGDGKTAVTPFYFWLSQKQQVDEGMVAYLMQEAGNPASIYVVFQLTAEDQPGVAYEREYGLKFTRVETPVDPTEPTEPPLPTDPTNPTDPEPSTEPTEPPTTEPSEPATDPTEQTQEPTTEPTEPEPAPAAAMVYTGETKTSYSMSFFVPGQDDMGEQGPQIDWNSGYTEEELRSLRKEKEAQIVQLEHEVKMGKAELNIMKKEAGASEVRAEFDGVISSVLEPENAAEFHQPVVKLNGGGGFYVEGSVGELDLESMQLGQKITVTSWENGQVFEGEVVQIGQYPSQQQMGYYPGNSNQSFYPYRVFISEDANLMEDSYVGLSYKAQQSESGTLLLQTAFVLTEGGQSYVYVQNDQGRLEKRQIQTGVSRDGYFTPVYGGIDESDMLAFPYGKEVKEGAKTFEGTTQDLYGY